MALEDLQWVTLIGDADTPVALQKYIGRAIGLPAGEELPTQPSDYRLAGELPGYARQSLVSETPWEWIITAPSDKLLTAIRLIPGPQGWTDKAAEQSYVQLAVQMRQAGLTASAIKTGLRTAYVGGSADLVARQAAEQPTDPPPGG